MRLEFIKLNIEKYKLKNLLSALDVKKSYWDKYKNKSSKSNEFKLVELIKEIFEFNRKQFGYRRITKELNELGYKINHKKVARIMKENNICAKYVIKMKKAAALRYKRVDVDYPDLLERKFDSVDERFKVLYTDVTYIIHNGKRAYQLTIIDGYTKEIVDYKIGWKDDLDLVLNNVCDALLKIKNNKKDLSGIIIHSDHGSQYTSNTYKSLCESVGLIISMGKTYCCTDNIVIESFHSLLKKGTLHNNNYYSIEEYISDLCGWNNWYNYYIQKRMPDFVI